MTAALVDWADALREVSDAGLDNAVRQCRTEHPDWPPTLGQFLRLCEDCRPRVSPIFRALPESPEHRARLDDMGRQAFRSLRQAGVIS